MPILPLYPPPPNRGSPSLPTLPTRPRSLAQPFENPAWTVTTHVLPAAFPRSRAGSTRLRGAQPVVRAAARMTKDELEQENVKQFDRQRRAAEVTTATAEAESEIQEQLWLCVNRYARIGALHRVPGAFTITWEPALSSVVDNLPPGLVVDEIWSLDSLHQGDSALLNDGAIGDTNDWLDYGRDAAAFVANYLPPSPSTESPYHLPYHAVSSSLPERRIVGIGHSLGAAGIAVAASMLPSHFTALVLVDGVMFPQTAVHADNHAPILAIAKGALSRKDFWPGREAAEAEMRTKTHFYGLWDDRVLKRFVEFALVDSGDEGGVRLKTRKEDEALVFADPERRGSFAAFSRLPVLSPSLRVHWVFAGNAPMVPVWAQHELFAATGQCHTSHTAIEGSGHLVTQEKPDALGKEIARFLGRLVAREKL